MLKTVRIAAGVAGAVAMIAFGISCSDATGLFLPTYTATLVAASEVPPTTVTGTGTATLVDHGTFFEYEVSVTGLTAISAAHIHGPAAVGVNAGIVENLFIPNGPPFGQVDGVLATGVITSATNASLTIDALRTMIIAGNAYVNVHTNPGFPGGAIRGQLVRSN